MASRRGDFLWRHGPRGDQEECLLPSRRDRLRRCGSSSRVAARFRPRASSREAAFLPLTPSASFSEDDGSGAQPFWASFSSPLSPTQTSAALSQKDRVESAVLDVISQAAGKAVQQALANHYSTAKQGSEGRDAEPVTEAMVRIMPGNIGIRAEATGGVEAEDRLLSLPPLTCRFAIDRDSNDPAGKPKIRHVATELAPEAPEGGPEERQSSISTRCTITPTPSLENLSSFSTPAQTARHRHSLPVLYAPAGPLPVLYPVSAGFSPSASASLTGLPKYTDFPSARFRSLCRSAALLDGNRFKEQRKELSRSGMRGVSAVDEKGIDGILSQTSLSATPREGEAEQRLDETGLRRGVSTAERLELRKLLKGVVKLWSTKKQYDNAVDRLKEWARDRYLASGQLPDRTQLVTEVPGVRSQCCHLKLSVKQQAKSLRQQMMAVLPAEASVFSSAEDAAVPTKKPAVTHSRKTRAREKEGHACLTIGEKLERIEHLLGTIERALPPQDPEGPNRSGWLGEQEPMDEAVMLRRLLGTFRQVRAVQSQLTTLLRNQGKCVSAKELLHGDCRSAASSTAGRRDSTAPETPDGKDETDHAEENGGRGVSRENGEGERHFSAEQAEVKTLPASPGPKVASTAVTPLLRKKLVEMTAQRDRLEDRLSAVVGLHQKQQELLVDLAKENEKHLSELLTLRGSHRIFGCVYTPNREASTARSWYLPEDEEDPEEAAESAETADTDTASRFALFERLESQAAHELEARRRPPEAGGDACPNREAEMRLSVVKAFLARRSNPLLSLLPGGSRVLLEPGSRRQRRTGAFEFDRVYPAGTPVGNLFQGFADLIQNCVGDGVNLEFHGFLSGLSGHRVG
ncbi:putative kinesin motor domain-containing protein [Neospora caninum Liverpool]|uniref:Putative kinesin motor domain-containing protein n=1 Tax=Neospora caninum (strain Liverpool) TaxID=572307 RepID=F0VFN5_NEOCL|nr:putative kinesin motor domain-containing protein [Neospora caninum Liverpool]CBZ52529.1 putative kinesin motor domain-containing protein [Neospora caninum Liverpool]|eukprot:XP_003882561.1 putative kinesin motor domain-containing protein [Neospora caninum Liverpool]